MTAQTTCTISAPLLPHSLALANRTGTLLSPRLHPMRPCLNSELSQEKTVWA
ncbi:hypothetical protein Scep_023469 [Stephania cephalantha]|uniref:Uncharacterized protein n=1 Tax=Stephania cephalantha TaxID=152367 RepID=A0AAP0EV84_9MAGN